MPAAILVAFLAVFLVAGCGSPAESPAAHVAHADQPPPVRASPARSRPAQASDYDKALAYARCMTANGAPTPDPVVGQALVTVNVVHRGDTVADLEAKKSAFAVCKHLLPTTWPLRLDPKEVARTAKFAVCVREHGVAWPEAKPDGLADWPTDPYALTTPAYEAAIQACRHFVDDPANSLPENQ